MRGPRTLATACAVIAGIEAVQMIHKGQVLGITRKTYMGRPGDSAVCSVSTSTVTEPTQRTAVPFNAVALLLVAEQTTDPWEAVGPFLVSGGGRGIRTPERVTPLTVFKTAAFNHSAIPPPPSYPLLVP